MLAVAIPVAQELGPLLEGVLTVGERRQRLVIQKIEIRPEIGGFTFYGHPIQAGCPLGKRADINQGLDVISYAGLATLAFVVGDVDQRQYRIVVELCPRISILLQVSLDRLPTRGPVALRQPRFQQDVRYDVYVERPNKAVEIGLRHLWAIYPVHIANIAVEGACL